MGGRHAEAVIDNAGIDVGRSVGECLHGLGV